jgi:UDP-N-acetylglucosamine--N-acetylmuramyl-(pentapeptide) pyrophosphoryl-undecaprenol N-acetylglucosamine transferase
VLIPFPYAADDHQTANAKNFADRGAAILISDYALTGQNLFKIIQDLKTHPETRAKMETAMASLALPHAAAHIAGHILAPKKGHQDVSA